MHPWPLRRAVALVTGLSLALTGSVAAATSMASAAPGPVTITFWNEMTGPYKVALDAEIHAFEHQNPRIHVTDVVVPNDAALEPKLLAAIVAGNPPTISQVNPPWATGLIHTGSLVNLSPYMQKTPAMAAKNFYASLLAGGRWPDGNVYVLPFNISTALLFYNETAFQKAHIAGPPRTWAAFTEDAMRLSGKNREAFAITLVHSYPWLAFFYQQGGNFITKTGMPNPAAFAPNGPAVKALNLWANLVRHHAAVLTQGYASQTDFADQTSSILVGTSAFYPYLVPAVGGKFPIGIATLPRGTVSATSIFGGYLGLFSHSTAAQTTAALKFVQYLTSPTGTTYWMEHSDGYLPVRPSVVRTAASYLRTHPAQRVAMEALATGQNPPKVAWWDQFNHEVLLNDITAVLIGKESAQAAMKSAYAQAVQLAHRDGTYQ